jgi:hypothetical protein
VQLPVLQEATALVKEHVELHEPQLESVLSCVSQPLLGSPSQLPQPALQVIPQLPPLHVAVPLVALQTVPQLPQLAMLFDRFVSQPLV